MNTLISRLFVPLSLLAASLLVSACGFGAQPTPTPEPVTLRYVTFAGLDAAEQALIDAFRASHPYVTVAPETYNRAPEDYLAMTPPPDLMLITPGEFLDGAIDRNALVDLSDLWQQTGVDEQVAGALAALSERGGKQYYVPTGYNWNGIYYNKQIFEQYGLEAPHTWDEFTQLAETLWLEGIVPFSVSGGDPFMGTLWLDYLNLRLNGSAFHQEFLAGDVPYDDPRLRTVFELWASLVEKGYFLRSAATLGIDDALAAVAPSSSAITPQAAMVLSGPAFLGALAPAQREQLGFFPFPILDAAQPPAEVVMSIGYMVPSAAPHRDEALAFAGLLASADGRDLMAQDIAGSGLYAPFFGAMDALPDSVRQGVDLVQSAQALTAPYYMSVPPSMWAALMTMQRNLLTEPGSGQVFDLDGLLATLEAAR